MAMDLYHTKMAEEAKAQRKAQKAAEMARLQAELEALRDSDDEEISTLTTNVALAGCESPTSPPPHPCVEAYQNNFRHFQDNSNPQGTFNEAAFMQQAANGAFDVVAPEDTIDDAELAKALAEEEAAAFYERQQQQQQKASHV